MPTAPCGGGGGVAPRATGGGVSGYLLLVTRDKPPFAEVSGDRPPRHADACHPSAEGNFIPRWERTNAHRTLWGRVVSRPARCIAWVVKPGVVRDCGIIHLIPCHSRARGPRKYECICGVVKAGIGLGLLIVI